MLLLGPSGCGKSTLLQVLSGMVPSVIEIPMKAEELRTPERWGYVFQDPDTQFCMPYVDEEIAFVLENMQVPREQMPALIRHYLELVGLQFEDIHTPIQNLSQGMKQRLAIASVLALEPEVLFLDEPTALLDEEGTQQVWETIRATSEGKTLLIVEHKIHGILDLIDRVIVLTSNGEILADGEPAAVFASYKKELIDFGIWYPGVWEDYDTERGDICKEAAAPSSEREVLITLDGFQALRGGEVKLETGMLTVGSREWVAVAGHNGAGKSSLLLGMMRLVPTKGICEIAGVRGKKVADIADHVAFVFQNPEFQFVTGSVEEEIAYSLEEGQEGQVEELLRKYQLVELRSRHPFQLSMGQKRRLSVASALVRKQRILLLDEPTFGLDARNTFHMLEMLEELRQEGTSIMMVTHDHHIIQRFADRVWQVQRGQVSDLTPGQYLEQFEQSEKGEVLLCN
ncbi:ABC transporter ATP-binding protein [Paenibacillus hexagrammi]|uniref:Energy-coupling factor ABC transporter ATP-binding protein n=1 Tax=Paenibacillus hexagrammi TaxID=2908839 RepID=A0ABY3SIC7_9BACL|nr:ABC transporter ATP-binding protein [Paenibacillus sp. YPD9-1]UJF32994.1 energy-coupling factor ABC transporter ATP-binding protein [Paenibacillus sp. YPD9-1]